MDVALRERDAAAGGLELFLNAPGEIEAQPPIILAPAPRPYVAMSKNIE